MYYQIIFFVSLMFCVCFGAPQFINDQYYLTSPLYYPTNAIFDRYVVLIPREGAEGGGGGGQGGFWDTLIGYFNSCDEGGEGGDDGGFGGFGSGKYQRKRIPIIIPPPIESKLPDKEAEKIDAPEKEKVDENKPSKPFYYVLPPNSNRPISYRLENFIRQPNNFNSFYYGQLLPQNTSIKPERRIQGRINSGA